MATRGFNMFVALEATKAALRKAFVTSYTSPEVRQRYEDAVHAVADRMEIKQIFLVIECSRSDDYEYHETVVACCESPITAEEICVEQRKKEVDGSTYEIRPRDLF